MKKTKAANVVDRDQQSPSSPVITHNPVNVPDVPHSAATDAESDAIVPLYCQHFERCCRIASSRGISDPEDCVQDVFLSLFKARNSSTIDTTYLLRRTYSRTNTAYKRKCRRQERETEFALQLSEAAGEDESDIEALELQKKVEAIFSVLTALERRVLKAYYLNGLSIDAISRRSGRSASALKSILFRARNRARSQEKKSDATQRAERWLSH